MNAAHVFFWLLGRAQCDMNLLRIIGTCTFLLLLLLLLLFIRSMQTVQGADDTITSEQ